MVIKPFETTHFSGLFNVFQQLLNKIPFLAFICKIYTYAKDRRQGARI